MVIVVVNLRVFDIINPTVEVFPFRNAVVAVLVQELIKEFGIKLFRTLLIGYQIVIVFM